MEGNPQKLFVRPILSSDALVWESMRCALWPDGNEDHRMEIAEFFAGTLDEPEVVVIATDTENAVVGLVELSTRFNVPGLGGRKTGYVEGLYVIPAARQRNVARILLKKSREWARKNECSHFASDRVDRIVIDRRFGSRS